MSWKDILKEEITKTPFDSEIESRQALENNEQRLNSLLEEHIDDKFKQQIARNPTFKEVTIKVDASIHNLLMQEAGSHNRLERHIMQEYNLADFYINPKKSIYSEAFYHFALKWVRRFDWNELER